MIFFGITTTWWYNYNVVTYLNILQTSTYICSSKTLQNFYEILLVMDSIHIDIHKLNTKDLCNGNSLNSQASLEDMNPVNKSYNRRPLVCCLTYSNIQLHIGLFSSLS